MLGCDIDVVKSVDGILPTPMDFILIVSMILARLPLHLTMTTGSCQGRLMVLQLELEPLLESGQAPLTNVVRFFLKGYIVIRDRHPMQGFITSSLTSPRCCKIKNNGE